MRKLKLLLILLLAPGAGLGAPLRLFAGVVPIQTFVQEIGGAYVDARVMVRPGYNPHTYDPTPQQVRIGAGQSSLTLMEALKWSRNTLH